MRRTQRAIKQVLTERYYSWREAEIIAKTDRDINLSGNGPVYDPLPFEEGDEPLDLTEEEIFKTIEENKEAEKAEKVASEQKAVEEIAPGPEVKSEPRTSPTV